MSDDRVFTKGEKIDVPKDFEIADVIKTIIGAGTFIIAGLMAREASKEGIELFEDKVNGSVDKIKTFKSNKKTPPPPAK